MVRSGLFESAGGFPEDYFMYFEDAALCTSLARAGHQVWLEPRASVLHHVGAASGGPLAPLPVYFSERNRIVLSREVLSPLLRAAFLLYVTAVLLVKTLKFTFWQGPHLVPWIWRGYRDGILRRTGFRKGIRTPVT
jgi:GT2 family glycosyltransferase